MGKSPKAGDETKPCTQNVSALLASNLQCANLLMTLYQN